MKLNSLSFRLLWAVGIVLMTSFALTVMVLEKAFEHSTEQALQEKLQTQIYALLSVAEMDSSLQLKMPKEILEPRFRHPGSGLYANIRLSDRTLVWRSTSSVGVELPFPAQLQQGEFAFVKDVTAMRFYLHYAVLWENELGFERHYIFTVAEDGRLLENQVAKFRTTLMGWLTVIGVLLVIAQLLVLHWGLKPLRRIVKDLAQIESGEKKRLDGRYPVELKGLAGNLNALIGNQRGLLERYRKSLADLSHSLKTPLAILSGCAESDDIDRNTLAGQIARMNEIIEYQLQKAAARGEQHISKKVEINEILEKIIGALQKVYSSKQVDCQLLANKKHEIYCEEGDIYEIAGNLLDNAFKWCERTVRISLIELNPNQQTNNCSLALIIEDDGPGVADDKINEIMRRGVRADQNKAGHGIGMAVVNELVGYLGGQLVASKSAGLGGMQWQVLLG